MTGRPGDLSINWYRDHREGALCVAVGLYVLISVFVAIDTNSSDGLALLYMLPVALLAVTWGFRGGLVGAAIGCVSFCTFSLIQSSGYMGSDAWVTRAGAMFLLGGLLGRAADQSVRAHALALESQRAQMDLREQNRRYAEGIELSDSVLQYIAAAQWRIDAGDAQQASQLLSTAMEQGQRIVSELLPGQVVGRTGDLEDAECLDRPPGEWG